MADAFGQHEVGLRPKPWPSQHLRSMRRVKTLEMAGIRIRGVRGLFLTLRDALPEAEFLGSGDEFEAEEARKSGSLGCLSDMRDPGFGFEARV